MLRVGRRCTVWNSKPEFPCWGKGASQMFCGSSFISSGGSYGVHCYEDVAAHFLLGSAQNASHPCKNNNHMRCMVLMAHLP